MAFPSATVSQGRLYIPPSSTRDMIASRERTMPRHPSRPSPHTLIRRRRSAPLDAHRSLVRRLHCTAARRLSGGAVPRSRNPPSPRRWGERRIVSWARPHHPWSVLADHLHAGHSERRLRAAKEARRSVKHRQSVQDQRPQVHVRGPPLKNHSFHIGAPIDAVQCLPGVPLPHPLRDRHRLSLRYAGHAVCLSLQHTERPHWPS